MSRHRVNWKDLALIAKTACEIFDDVRVVEEDPEDDFYEDQAQVAPPEEGDTKRRVKRALN